MGEEVWLFYTGDGLGNTGVGLATLDKSELRSFPHRRPAESVLFIAARSVSVNSATSLRVKSFRTIRLTSAHSANAPESQDEEHTSAILADDVSPRSWSMGLVALRRPPERRTQPDADLKAQMQRMVDRAAIEDLLMKYGRLLDQQDLVGYSKLFAADGVWEGGIGSAKGPKEIQQMLERVYGRVAPGRFGSSYHIMSDFLIDAERRHRDRVVQMDLGDRRARRDADHPAIRALRGPARER